LAQIERLKKSLSEPAILAALGAALHFGSGTQPVLGFHDEAFLKQFVPDCQPAKEEPNTFSSIWLKRI
jgi:hypothetical protein